MVTFLNRFIGNLLCPTLANVFMCHIEKWLRDCPSEFKPDFYRRYFDDTFLFFVSPDSIDKFLDYVSNERPNISFTCDKEQNETLLFLDISIKRDIVSFNFGRESSLRYILASQPYNMNKTNMITSSLMHFEIHPSLSL